MYLALSFTLLFKHIYLNSNKSAKRSLFLDPVTYKVCVNRYQPQSHTVGVNIKFPYRAVYRPYRTFKKRLARPYRFILLGMTQYYCYTRSEYRAESSLKWIFLLCLYRCCSSRLFLTRPFRFSLSIVSALLVD